jgi:hypothetical protein
MVRALEPAVGALVILLLAMAWSAREWRRAFSWRPTGLTPRFEPLRRSKPA